jgi:GAF domain-containing protein/HAMP domain-containing protein
MERYNCEAATEKLPMNSLGHKRFNQFGKRKSSAQSQPAITVQADNALLLAIILLVAMLILGSIITYYSLPILGWKEVWPTIPSWFMAVMSLVSILQVRSKRAAQAVNLITISFLFGMLLQVLVIEGNGLTFALSAFLITASIAMQTLPTKQSNQVLIVSALEGIALFFLDIFSPVLRPTGDPVLQILIPVAYGILTLIFVFLLVGQSRFYALRARLIFAFLFVALLPITILTYLNYRGMQNALSNVTNQALASAAMQMSQNIDNFLEATTERLETDSQTPALIHYLELPEEQRKDSPEETEANTFLSSLRSNDYVKDFFLLNREGEILLDSSGTESGSYSLYMGLDVLDPAPFKGSMLLAGLPYQSPVIFSSPADKREAILYFAARVENTAGFPVGILMARYDASVLQYMVTQNMSLAGPRSYAILFDENNMRLADASSPKSVYSLLIPPKTSDLEYLRVSARIPNFPEAELFANTPELAQGMQTKTDAPTTFQARVDGEEINTVAVVPLKNKPWRVAYLQPRSIYLSPILDQTRVMLLIGLVVLVVTFVMAFALAGLLTKPITGVTQVAQKVASGDLTVNATESNDEIGQLGKAFNTMTSELRNTLEELEGRVAIRTSELARATEQAVKRTKQLETVAEVAHAVASVQDPDQLLNLVTRLISERFSFYHVGIFLLDDKKEYAILQAANSEGGQRMLGRGHRLRVGQVGIVGYATGRGEPRIALDVGKDAVFFDNPDLPYTRSEMALPLKIGDRVIGALDVQSMEQSAFTDEDVELLSTLADQVAIAIENTRLFSETRLSLAELQTLHRQYLQQEWARVVDESGKTGYRYEQGKLIPLPDVVKPDLWNTIEESGQAVLLNDAREEEAQETSVNKSLVVPISVRGQVIGMLNLGKPSHVAHWNEDEINLVKTVADQVGLAIENARLLEQTYSRAEREHAVADITAKLRASNDPQVILQTAVRELRQALGAKTAQVTIPPSSPLASIPEETLPGGNGDHSNHDDVSQSQAGG